MPEASSIAVVPSATDRSEPSGSVIVMSAMGGEATVASRVARNAFSPCRRAPGCCEGQAPAAATAA